METVMGVGPHQAEVKEGQQIATPPNNGSSSPLRPVPQVVEWVSFQCNTRQQYKTTKTSAHADRFGQTSRFHVYGEHF